MKVASTNKFINYINNYSGRNWVVILISIIF